MEQKGGSSMEQKERQTVDTGELFLEACDLLGMTEEEQHLAEELLEAGSLLLEEIRDRGMTGLSPAFVHLSDRVFLHPVFLHYQNGEFPEEEAGSLPPGMELILPEEKALYGGELAAEEAAGLLGSERRTRLCVVWMEQEEAAGRFLAEQTAARMGMSLLLWDGRETDWQSLLLTGVLYHALICLDIRKSGARKKAVQLADRADRFLVLADHRKDAEGLQDRISCLFRQGSRICREDRAACIRDHLEAGGMLPDRLREKLCESDHSLWELRKVLQEFSAEMYWAPDHRITEARIAEILAGRKNIGEGTGGLQCLAANRRLEDLCLPEEQGNRLEEICRILKHRKQVMEEWGFQEKYAYGNGMALLFYGAPGTGKTMAAQAIAGELGMTLYRVDLSQLISKYIGETQKNIGRIFAQAGQQGGILLFDEADALFARRNEINDAQDKYSNAETAYLLQKMEEWDGICILATNLLQNFDEAFRRRITYMVNFPLPDETQRRAIWKKVFPARAVLEEDMNTELLASAFELSGASIRSAALQGACLAAADGREIGMYHVLKAISNEYAKMNKSMKPEQKALIEKYRDLL